MSGLWAKIADALGSSTPTNWVWVKLEDTPHSGFSSISDNSKNPFNKAIKVTGLSFSEARRFYGRLIDWEDLTEKEIAKIKSGGLEVNAHQFERLLK